MNFDHLLKRADEEVLQLVVGSPVMRLLALMDPELATPRSLRRLVEQGWDPIEILRNGECRTALLELLPPADAAHLVNELRLPAGDPYRALRGLRLRKGSAQERTLFDYLAVTEPPTAVETQAPSSDVVRPTWGLFDHQRVAARRVRNALDGDQRRVLLHMPTGSGKTRTAMSVVSDYLRAEEPSLVLWLAFSEELCAQAAEEFRRSWEQLGDRPCTLHRYWGSHNQEIDDLSDGLVVAGLGKLFARMKRDADFILRLADRADLVVFDEAHQAVAPTYAIVLEALLERRRTTRLLGLSATPGRTWNDPDEDLRLADFFYRQKVTLAVEGYASPIDYLADEGYLADARFLPLHYSGGREFTDEDRRRLEESLDIPESVLRVLADDEQRNLLILTQVEQLARSHERILVFAATVEHARVLSAVLNARGLEARAVSAGTPPDVRSRIVTRFRSGAPGTMVLVNFGVFTAGFDAPRTSAAVIARPTRSLVLYSQMVGRAIRGPLAGGNETATIFTVVDTQLPGFARIADAFMNWEDVW